MTVPPLIVLAGGLGIRLRSVVADKPKILASIGEEPYLHHLVQWARGKRVEHIHFCLGYLADQVIDWLTTHPGSIRFTWQVEAEQLGTGGAVVEALSHPALRQSDSVMICNGDTFVDFDMQEFIELSSACHAGILTTQVADAGRYGTVTKDSNQFLSAFEEKHHLAIPGEINAGWYYFSGEMLYALRECSIRSLEHDFLMKTSKGPIRCICIGRDFLDFGTPESYQVAQTLFKDCV